MTEPVVVTGRRSAVREPIEPTPRTDPGEVSSWMPVAVRALRRPDQSRPTQNGPAASNSVTIRRTITITKYRGQNHFIMDQGKALAEWKQSKSAGLYEDPDPLALVQAISDLDTGNKVYETKEEFFKAVAANLSAAGMPLVLKPSLPTVGKATPSKRGTANARVRPTTETLPVLTEALDNAAAQDAAVIALSPAEVAALAQQTQDQRIQYVARFLTKALKKATAPSKTPVGPVDTGLATGTGQPTKSTAGRKNHPVPTVAITQRMVRDAVAAYDRDAQIDKSPKRPTLTSEQQKRNTDRLAGLLPVMHSKDQVTFREVDDLWNKRAVTELIHTIAQELVVNLGVLDPSWMDLKPTARAALRDMIGNAKEFGGLRGVVGEVGAAMYAAGTGRTDVSVSNDKYFDPDHRGAWLQQPGLDFQDVDVTSNTERERFYTEAKYDMGTFLAKASETVAQAEKRVEDAADTAEKHERESAGRKALPVQPSSTSPVDVPVGANPVPKRPRQPRTAEPEASHPAQLHRYEKAANRTKRTPPKKPRAKRLELYIANSHDWLRLFLGHAKLIDYLTKTGWQVVVETSEVMGHAAEIGIRFEKLRHAILDAEKGKKKIDIDGWTDALSVAVRPQEFLALSETDLQARSEGVFRALNSGGVQ